MLFKNIPQINTSLSASIATTNKIYALLRGEQMNTINNVTKGAALTIYVPIYDAEFGELITGAAALDSEISKGGSAFYDCTNELTELGTTGVYSLLLTATEMSADSICVKMTTTTAGAKIMPVAIYPTV
jgi:hypothetical protein